MRFGIFRRRSSKKRLFFIIVIFSVYLFLMDYNLPTEPKVDLPNQLVRQSTRIRVLCWVMTHPENHEKKAIHIKNTWGKKCDKLLFMSSVDDAKLPSVNLNVREGRNFLWGKTKAAFKYVYDKHINEADWFMRADDDTFVVFENLKLMLSEYDPNDAVHFGGMFKYPKDNQRYFSGGPGFVISKEALIRFVKKALPNPDKCRGNDTTFADDLEIGRCLEHVGIKAINTRDNERLRFLPLSLEHILAPAGLFEYLYPNSSWYWRYTPFPHKLGLDCCSETAVGFHYVKPWEMYLFHYLLYEFKSPYEFIVRESYKSSIPDSPSIIEYSIGPSREARALPRKVLCWHLISSNQSHAMYLKNTWGQRCDKLLFMSNISELTFQPELSTIRLKSVSNDYLMTALKYIYDNHFTEADWFVNGNISTYLVVENLKFELKSYDPRDPIYFKTGSGYILSKEALRKLVIEMSTLKEDCWKDDGELLQKCLKNVGIEINDLRDSFLLIAPDKVSSTAYHQKDSAIGFHNVTPTQLLAFDYLIYRLRPFGFAPDLDQTNYRFLVIILAILFIIYIFRKFRIN